MGLLSSKKRSTTNNLTEETNIATTDNRISEGDIGGNFNITFTGDNATSESAPNNSNAGGFDSLMERAQHKALQGTSKTEQVTQAEQRNTGQSVSIITSDLGALNAAEEFGDIAAGIAGESLASARDAFQNATDIATATLSRGAQQSGNVVEAAKNFVESDSTEIFKFAVIGVAVVSVAYLVAKRG